MRSEFPAKRRERPQSPRARWLLLFLILPVRIAVRVRTREGTRPKTTSFSGVLKFRDDGSSAFEAEGFVRARAIVEKSSLLRYKVRWHEIGMLHRLLETGANRRPATETLDQVGQAIRGTN